MFSVIYWSSSDTAAACSNIDLWYLKRIPQRVEDGKCSLSRTGFHLERGHWGTRTLIIWRQRANSHVLCQYHNPANGSGNSQWDVQPFLHLQVKPGALLYQLEQSERKYQLNLRMTWGSERVPPWLLFSSSVYCFKGPLCKKHVAFWKRRLFYLLVVGRSSNYSPSCLYYGILGFILLPLPCAVWDPWQINPQPKPVVTTEVSCQRTWIISELLNTAECSCVCSGKCVGDRSECPGAQSPRVAPQQVQHQMETEVTWDSSKLILDKTLMPTFCLQGSVLTKSMQATFQGDWGERGKFNPGSGLIPWETVRVNFTRMKRSCLEIPIHGSSSPDCTCPYSHQWPGCLGGFPAISVTGASPFSLPGEITTCQRKCSSLLTHCKNRNVMQSCISHEMNST